MSQSRDSSMNVRLENQLCFPLYVCAKEAVRQYRKPLEKLGLTYTQYVVLMAFWEHGSMTEGTLGRIVHLDSGTLSPLLKRLEKQRLVRRIRSEANERTLWIELTEAGSALKQSALQVSDEIEAYQQLPIEEYHQLKELLNRAMKRMKAANK
ncbi:MAG: MarR family winged helix-turn-helix transcriptional regulator [Eubacterium sp.]